MVARIGYGKSINRILNYNENKVKEHVADLILANQFACEVDDLSFNSKLHRFENMMMNNTRSKSNAIHISLNFDLGESIPLSTLQEISIEYMERIGFDEQPYLAYQHFDAAHPHIHIITTNIQEDGKRIDLHNIGRNQSETARKEIEEKYGLVKADSKKTALDWILKPAEINSAIYSKSETKRTISNIVGHVMHHYNFTSLAEYNAALSCFNVQAERGQEGTVLYDKRGIIYSIIDKEGKKVGLPIKASSFFSKPTLKNLEAKFAANEGQRKDLKGKSKAIIDKILNSPNSISKEKFTQQLKTSGIEPVFRQNAEGFIYGITYVNHKDKVVFNGSDLGKEYSAKSIVERFAPEEIYKQDSGNKVGTHPANYPSEITHALGVNGLEDLLKSENTYEGLPSELKKKRKRKRNKPNL